MNLWEAKRSKDMSESGKNQGTSTYPEEVGVQPFGCSTIGQNDVDGGYGIKSKRREVNPNPP